MKTRYLFVVIIIAVLVRSFYFFNDPKPAFTPDSGTYIVHSIFLFRDHRIITAERTPGYPLFIGALLKLSQPSPDTWEWQRFEVSPPKHIGSFFPIIFAQMALGIISTVILFYLARALIPNLKLAFAATLLAAINPNVFGWEKLVITESLSISLVVILIWVSLLLFKRVRLGLLLLLCVLSIYAILLRPALFYLPAVLFGFLLLKRRTIILVLITAIITYGAIFAYMEGNKKNNGFFGLTSVSHINLLGKVFQYDFPLLPGRNSEENNLVGLLQSYKATYPTSRDPWNFIVNTGNPYYMGDYYMVTLNGYTQYILLRHLPAWIFKSLLLIPQILTTPMAFIVIKKDAIFGQTLSTLSQITYYAGYVYLMTVILFPLLFLRIKKNAGKTYWPILLVFCIVFTHLFTSTLFGYAEYARLRAPIEPLLPMVTIGTLCLFWKKEKTYANHSS